MRTADTIADVSRRPGARPAGSTFSTSDVWGGLAAMLVAFPSAIAFGVIIYSAASPQLASAGALAGLIGAAALGIVAPLVGRNGGFISAPCAPAAAVLSGVAIDLAGRGTPTSRIITLIALTALVSALLQLAYGAMRFGRVIKFIPYQVVTGYLSGVAVIIAMAQVPKLLGTPSGMHFAEAVISPQVWRWPGIAVGLITAAAMALAPRFTTRVPGAIIGLVTGIASYFAISLIDPPLRQLAGNSLVIGPIQAAGSFLQGVTERGSLLGAIRLADLALVLGPALTLSILLSIDTLKTGVVLDALTRRRHNSNRELIGQGAANAVSFFSGGVPGAGTMGPTVVNVTSGGRSLWSGVLEGLFILVALVALKPLMAWVPIAALAGILLVIAFRMFDFHMFRLLFVPSTRLDFFVIASVVVVAETVGLIEATLVGVCLAILLFMRNQMRGSVIFRKSDLTATRSKRRRGTEQLELLEEHGTDAAIVQLKDDLFFGTTDQLFTELESDIADRRFICLDFRRVQSMDYTAAQLLTQMQNRLRERGAQLVFCGMPSTVASRQDIGHYLAQLGVTSEQSGIRIFDSRDGALEWLEERVLENAGFAAAESKPPLTLGEVNLLGDLDEEILAELSPHVREVSLTAGEHIFKAGDAGDGMYFVRRGRIHILLPLEGGKRHHLATLGRGEFFGEMTFLDQGARSADAEAAVPTELFALSRATFDQLAESRPSMMAIFEQLALAIAQRLRLADAELRALEER